jgi:hypothetical protein
MSKTPTYSVWCEMRRRCEDPHRKSYPDHGGRGIKVCARWRTFEIFLADMGTRPSPPHEITRIDNDAAIRPETWRGVTTPLRRAEIGANRKTGPADSVA